ncbi:hypothetical protein H0H87_007227 [Tephrocybe sp. NHM501043]|nr:hypothetical protein H0H87_007227 [Tephrocybe sp. NHM501043]
MVISAYLPSKKADQPAARSGTGKEDLMMELADQNQQIGVEGIEGQAGKEVTDIMGRVYKNEFGKM